MALFLHPQAVYIMEFQRSMSGEYLEKSEIFGHLVLDWN